MHEPKNCGVSLSTNLVIKTVTCVVHFSADLLYKPDVRLPQLLQVLVNGLFNLLIIPTQEACIHLGSRLNRLVCPIWAIYLYTRAITCFLQMLQLLFDTLDWCFRGNWEAEVCWEKGSREVRKGQNIMPPCERSCCFCGLCTSAVYSTPAQRVSQTPVSQIQRWR